MVYKKFLGMGAPYNTYIPSKLTAAAGSNGGKPFLLTNDLISSANWGRNMYSGNWDSRAQNVVIDLWIEAWKYAGFTMKE